MFIGNDNPWSAPVRTLSALGSSAGTGLEQQNQTLAAGASFNAFAGALQYIYYAVAVKSSAAGSITIFGYDGTNTYTLTFAAAGPNTAAITLIVIGTTVGARVTNNDGANPAGYATTMLIMAV
jgi:hypothetical protein